MKEVRVIWGFDTQGEVLPGQTTSIVQDGFLEPHLLEYLTLAEKPRGPIKLIVDGVQISLREGPSEEGQKLRGRHSCLFPDKPVAISRESMAELVITNDSERPSRFTTSCVGRALPGKKVLDP